MPHDTKGRLIQVGDYVKAPYGAAKAIGRVSHVWEGSSTCNLQIGVTTPYAGIQGTTVTAAECELVLKADGSEPA
jgi:hypothetical protein